MNAPARDLDSSRWTLTDCGWRHRPRWKVALNTILRAIQAGRRWRWLFVSNCEGEKDGRPVCVGYGFARVLMEGDR